MKDFLLELQTEELPPKLLSKFGSDLANNLKTELQNNSLDFTKVIWYATPRRLAVVVEKLAEKSPDKEVDKKGPSTSANEKAILGFAKSCDTDVKNLTITSTDKGEYYFYQAVKKGVNTTDVIIDLCNNAITKMHFSRPMRWGANSFSFIRPVHQVIALFDNKIINGEILGIKTNNITTGLRFEDNKIIIDSASNYRQIMSSYGIEVDFVKRREIIWQQITQITKDNNLQIVENKSLLDEVCAIVENPKAFIGTFDKEFLDLPVEVISSSMAEHQKYWTVIDENNNLVNKFIAVSNNNPDDMSIIINGNEKVVRPRLADAAFFYAQDKKTTLETKTQKLKTVAFMQGLGSMFDKTTRIVELSSTLTTKIDADINSTMRAALLLKADLVSGMVDEFASLQGIMGGYYAKFDGEDQDICDAITMQYHPRFAGDSLPTKSVSIATNFADKLDTIAGVFLIGKGPTGSKDPFALRRLALGLMRIIIENKININLPNLITTALDLYQQDYDKNLTQTIHNFMLDRLKNYYDEQNIKTNTFVSATIKNHNPYDLHTRILVLNQFMLSADSTTLIEINKRISNILKDAKFQTNDNLNLELEIENQLYAQIQNIKTDDYNQLITDLITLKPTLDEFFNSVMINDSDENKKNNRLNLIAKVRGLFLNIGDFAKLK
jgi:glycyl-tRNA synthetase beta chain